MILQTVQQPHERTRQPIWEVLEPLGIPPATYSRWAARAQASQLADRFVQPHRHAPPPIPEEVQAVDAVALEHPAMGYKRLAWLMVGQAVAYLCPDQVYRILQEANLVCPRPSAGGEDRRRPPEPDHPDQVGHSDLMYLYIAPRWDYLVAILDGYSRFLGP